MAWQQEVLDALNEVAAAIVGDKVVCDLGSSIVNVDIAAVDVSSIVDGIAGDSPKTLFDLDADLVAIETLITAGNVDLAAMESKLTAILSDCYYLQYLSGISNYSQFLETIDGDTSAMATDIGLIQIDIGTMQTDIAAIKAQTNKLSFGGQNQLKVVEYPEA